jgi:hypothetical protein
MDDPLKKTSRVGTILILLLLYSACVAPVMAADKQSAVVEDGVHFLKFDTSPTKLDPQFYKNMDIGVNFVVDGNQFYWVRIGNEASKGLTSVWWVPIVVLSLIFFCISTTTLVWYNTVRRKWPVFFTKMYIPPHVQGWKPFIKNVLLFMIPILIIAELVLNPFVYGMLGSSFTHIVYGKYPDLVSSDGTILLQVDKLHPETNTLYTKSGVNQTTLTHFSGCDTVLKATGVKSA